VSPDDPADPKNFARDEFADWDRRFEAWLAKSVAWTVKSDLQPSNVSVADELSRSVARSLVVMSEGDQSGPARSWRALVAARMADNEITPEDKCTPLSPAFSGKSIADIKERLAESFKASGIDMKSASAAFADLNTRTAERRERLAIEARMLAESIAKIRLSDPRCAIPLRRPADEDEHLGPLR
jgi:hypothetical protein